MYVCDPYTSQIIDFYFEMTHLWMVVDCQNKNALAARYTELCCMQGYVTKEENTMNTRAIYASFFN